MVGEVNVAIAGQNATIQFLNDQIVLEISDYKTAWKIMKTPMPNLSLAARLLSFSEIGLMTRIGNRKPVELFPEPSWIVRLLSPSITGMLEASLEQREATLQKVIQS